MTKYIFTDDKKELYCSIIILDAIFNGKYRFISNLMLFEDQFLIPLFEKMVNKDLLEIDENCEYEYILTEKGVDFIQNFYQRYEEFVKFYDIYCAVDLTTGDFAFDKILDMSQEDFTEYLNDDRWEDVRIPVCEFKKIDAMQMIFISFLRDGRYDVGQTGWQSNILSDNTWNEITEICDSTIPVTESLQIDDQIKNMVNAGSQLLKNLLEREQNEQNQPEEPQTETTTVTTTEVIEEEVVENNYYNTYSYYEPYWYDPYYVSPCWGVYYDTPYWW